MRSLPLLLSLLCVSLGAAVVTSKDVGFSANFPEGKDWTPVKESNPQSGLRLWGQKQGPMNSLVVMRSVAKLQGTREEQFEGYRKGFAGKCEKVLSNEALELAGWPAYRIVGTTSVAGTTYYMTSYMALRGDVTYTITRLSDGMPETDLDFATFVKSIKLGE